ncbi:MAG: DNA topoisomerase 3 [Kiritimatiellae bacterium]|nr:DNA topoisomerase 3 [Kiritimatiellia bacterium]
MKVIIAEKPSVARDIASVLRITNKKIGFIEGRGCAVTWAFGHLVTLLEPGEYDANLKRWTLQSLPFIPKEFRLKLIKNRGVPEQFEVIQTLCQQADEIICATDAGREGELIFRYILTLSGCEAKPIRRLWLNSMTPDAVLEAFKNLKDGHEYDALYAAARSRSEADWIVGLNATRYFTVRHGRTGGGSDRVLWSVGRVQTPVLAMIVHRDDEIRNFIPQPFWELTTLYREVTFKYTGTRFDKPELAQTLLEKILGQPFEITSIVGKEKREQPPQLFDLTTLQREANKTYGLSAADTLKSAQSLYESKSITYPRTDSRYLNQDMKPRIPKIMEQLRVDWADEIAPLNLARLPFTSRIIDDKKVTDHHALIPTGVPPRAPSADELKIYRLITTQFIAAFYPPCVKKITTVSGVSNTVEFEAKGTQILKPGWSALFPKPSKKKDEDEDQLLPAFEKGESGPHTPALREGKTKPPSHFTENSLLGAMEAAGKQVDDDVLREALKERGIGTPATRAAIIETLLQRSYIERNKKQILATDMGRCLIALLQDPLLKSPEMTGEWEEQLKKIERNEIQATDFMEKIADYTRNLISTSSAYRIDTTRWGNCPLCGREIIKGKRAYGCSGWRKGCGFVLEPQYAELELTPHQIRTLLQLHILAEPLQIKEQPRLLVLSHIGQLIDIALPSADRQKKSV